MPYESFNDPILRADIEQQRTPGEQQTIVKFRWIDCIADNCMKIVVYLFFSFAIFVFILYFYLYFYGITHREDNLFLK